ncbi:rRNA maturation RNase YbeY [Cryomorphaceae bacterium 1068]|nr:rRNA maturation RNase YbeY [Cryomorphaceae bacterium 1068]
MAPVHFHAEHPDYHFDRQDDISEWIRLSCSKENVQIEQLDFIFCTDDDLLEINNKHLNHNYLTDVITFPYSEGELIAGDIFISIDRVKDNSSDLNTDSFDELCRVMIHGVLHLCGYHDKTEQEQAIMRNKEDYYLSLRSF